jgi:serine/threonine protein kinase
MSENKPQEDTHRGTEGSEQSQARPAQEPHMGTDGSTPSSKDDAHLGRIIAQRYRIIERIGKGGMGSVYRAEHTNTGKMLAVKLLKVELSRDLKLIARFRREAVAASRLNHENCVSVYDFGQDDLGNFFIVMEYIDGAGLTAVLREKGQLQQETIAYIAIQLLGALDTAHSSGVLHRDIKPQNIMLTEVAGAKDIVKVVDFGIAKIVTNNQADRVALTVPGTVFGTPEYMPPEQARGDALDVRADLYSVGVVLWHLLLGRSPFRGKTIRDTFMNVFSGEVAYPESKSGDVEYEASFLAVIRKSFCKLPEDRYPDAGAFLHALQPYSQRAGPIDPFPQEVSVSGFATDGTASETLVSQSWVANQPSENLEAAYNGAERTETEDGEMPAMSDSLDDKIPPTKNKDWVALEPITNGDAQVAVLSQLETTVDGIGQRSRSFKAGGGIPVIIAFACIAAVYLWVSREASVHTSSSAVSRTAVKISAQSEDLPNLATGNRVKTKTTMTAEPLAGTNGSSDASNFGRDKISQSLLAAKAAFSNGERQKALRLFQSVLELDKNSIDAHKGIVIIALQKMDYEMALPHLELLVQNGGAYEAQFSRFLELARQKAADSKE